MQEFWFCANCKSMNRASSQQCYRCKAQKAEATLATVANRQQDVVLTPGLDEEHREVAWTLMFRQRYISAWKLGYVAAGLIFGTLALATFATVQSVVLFLLRVSGGSSGPSVGQAALLGVTVLAGALCTILMVVVHSVFLGLTSMNAPALGSGSPRFDPVRAAFWWIESALWAIRGGLAFVVPPLLALFGVVIGGLIFGLAIGIVWLVCAFWVLGDPITNLGKPRRLLQDLWDRLGAPGSADSRIVTLWSFAWGTARGTEYAVSALVFVVIIVLSFARLFMRVAGDDITPASPDQTVILAGLISTFVVTVQLVADWIGLFLLARITIELSKRQRVREEWVLRGMDDAKARAYADSQVRDAMLRDAGQVAPATEAAMWPQPGLAPQPPAVVPQPAVADAAASAPGTTAADSPEVPYEQPDLPDASAPVIQPSASALGRYRVPLSEAGPASEVTPPPVAPPPVAPPATDLDLGSGI